jgi:hypothetical protein
MQQALLIPNQWHNMEKEKKKKIILASLGTAAAGVLGYFGFQWWKDNKASKAENQAKGNLPNTSSYLPGNNSPDSTGVKPTQRALPSGNNDFPLKKGSRGAHVKALQLALIAKYGSSILPKYGADSDFGNEVAAALQKEGFPSTIDESTFNIITGGAGNSSSSGIDAKKLADALYNAVENTDLNQALSTLKQMNSVDDYKAVNTEFETNTIGFVKKTLVNGLLDAFTNLDDKVKIRLELTRMGLKYNGTKWSLSGLDRQSLFTIKDTQVLEKDGRAMQVPANTILGDVVGEKNGWVYFFPLNAHVLLKVKQETIKQFNKQ